MKSETFGLPPSGRPWRVRRNPPSPCSPPGESWRLFGFGLPTHCYSHLVKLAFRLADVLVGFLGWRRARKGTNANVEKYLGGFDHRRIFWFCGYADRSPAGSGYTTYICPRDEDVPFVCPVCPMGVCAEKARPTFQISTSRLRLLLRWLVVSSALVDDQCSADLD